MNKRTEQRRVGLRTTAWIVAACTAAAAGMANAEPTLLTRVEALRSGAIAASIPLPTGGVLQATDLRVRTAGFAPGDVIEFGATSQTLRRHQDRSAAEVARARQPSIAYLSLHDPALGSLFRPHPNQIRSGVLDQPGAYAIINDVAYVSPPTPLSELDSDGDGLSDFDEMNVDGDASSYTPGTDTDPLDADTDGDTIDDGYESANGLNPNSADDAQADADGDRLDNLAEFEAGTRADTVDSDADGLHDGLDLAPTDGSSNVCSGADAVFANTLVRSGDIVQCGARNSITVQANNVLEAGGLVDLIAPRVAFAPSGVVPRGAQLRVRSQDPAVP